MFIFVSKRMSTVIIVVEKSNVEFGRGTGVGNGRERGLFFPLGFKIMAGGKGSLAYINPTLGFFFINFYSLTSYTSLAHVMITVSTLDTVSIHGHASVADP